MRPPAADDARRDLKFQYISWLGCLRHGQRNLVMVGLRIRGRVWAGFVSGQGCSAPPSARSARSTRASAQVSMSPGCLSPSSPSSVPAQLALASGSAPRRFRVWSLRPGVQKKADVLLSARSHNSPLQVYMGEIPGTKLRTHTPHSDGPRTTVPRTMAHMGHGAWAHRERHGPPRSRRPARPDTHWTHTTHIVQLTKLEPGPTRNRVRARAY